MEQASAGRGGVDLPPPMKLKTETRISVTPPAARSVATTADLPAKKLARQLDFAALSGAPSTTASAAVMARRDQVVRLQSPSPSPITAGEIPNQPPPQPSSMHQTMGTLPSPLQTANSSIGFV